MPSIFSDSGGLERSEQIVLKLFSAFLKSYPKYLPLSRPYPLELLISDWKLISCNFLLSQKKLESLETVETSSVGISSSKGRLYKSSSNRNVML